MFIHNRAGILRKVFRDFYNHVVFLILQASHCFFLRRKMPVEFIVFFQFFDKVVADMKVFSFICRPLVGILTATGS